VEGHWERGATRKGGSLGKGVIRKEVWGSPGEVTGKGWFTWKGGSMITEGHKKRWVIGKRKVIVKLGFTRRG